MKTANPQKANSGFLLAVVLTVFFWLLLVSTHAASTTVRVEPRESDELFANPGMGWQTFHRFADDDPNLQGLPSASAYFRSIRGWLPGTHRTDSSLQLPAGLAPGRYEVAVGVVDPRERQPAVRLANAGRDAEGWYRVSELEIVPCARAFRLRPDAQPAQRRWRGDAVYAPVSGPGSRETGTRFG